MTIAQRGENFSALVELMHRLRSPGGCPWDREQTLESLRRYLIEEAYEVIEAIDEKSPTWHCEELGDLLLQVVFQAELCAEQNLFGINDVTQSIVDKMVRRHPHVFGDAQVKNSAEVLQNWGRIKAKEKHSHGMIGGRLRGVPAALPALVRAERIGDKAAHAGFDWPDASSVRDKIDEELAEIDQAAHAKDPIGLENEIGDLLFAISRYATKLGLSAEDALRCATRRFERRFSHMEKSLDEAGREPETLDPAAWDLLWQAAKAEEKKASGAR